MEEHQSNNPIVGYQYPTIDLVKEEKWIKILNSLKPVKATLPVLWSFNNNIPVIKDLTYYNSLLVVGPPCIGKTTFLNQLCYSLLFKKHPTQLKFIIIDFKRLDFGGHESIANSFLAKLPDYKQAVVSDHNQLIKTLNSLCLELDNRFDLMKDAECKSIIDYNKKFVERKLSPVKGHQFFPYLLVVIDELADLIINDKNEINAILQRLVSNGYKAGILTIISTNQFLGDTLSSVLTSLIETRIVFRLNEKDDYRRFLNTSKINEYLPKGTFLYNENGVLYKGSTGTISDEDLEQILMFIHAQEKYNERFLLSELEFETIPQTFDVTDKDPLFEDAAKLIVANQIGSISLIQRKMKLGYDRAGRLMDQLQAAGIVGKNLGSKTREVLIKTDAELIEVLDALSS